MLAAMQLHLFLLILSWQCQRLLSISLLNLIEPQDIKLQQKVLQVLEIIRQEREFENILIYGSRPCVFHEVLPQLKLPTVLLSQGSTYQGWNFNTETLLLSCDKEAEQEQNNVTLLKLQQARRLVCLEEGQTPQELCETYFDREQHNVAMLNSDGNLFSCRCFQDENYVQLFPDHTNFSSIYVEQFLNMKGAIIRSELDQLAPRAMLYRDAEGKIRMIGYVANLINTFVERVNATLQLGEDYEFGKVTNYMDIAELANNNQIDIGTVFVSTIHRIDLDYFTFAHISTSLCFMIPLPQALPYMDIYTLIVDDLVFCIMILLFVIFSLMINYSRHLPWRQLGLANILVNDSCLRGLLGQSFPLPNNPSRHLKAICLLLCFSSLMTSTMYGCYLQSLFTHPPSEPVLRSYEDFRNSRYQVVADRRLVSPVLRSHHLNTDDPRSVYLVDDLNELIHMRDIFTDGYIYPVTELRFRTYAEQQKLFDQPVFYYSKDVCLDVVGLIFMPTRRYLPYRQKFEEHVMHIVEFGLSKHWIDRSFNDMVLVKQTELEDYSTPKIVEDSVYLRDLTWIFKIYATGHLLATFCFAIECYWGKYHRSRRISKWC